MKFFQYKCAKSYNFRVVRFGLPAIIYMSISHAKYLDRKYFEEEYEMQNPSKQIRLLIRQIHQSFLEVLTSELAAFNITGPQLLVLRCLKREPQRMSDISKQLGLSNSTVSGIVDRLEENGYVRRVRDEKDRRVVLVNFGKKFEEICKEVPILQDNYFDGLLSGMTEEEVHTIIRSLQLLAGHLTEKLEEKKK